MSNNNLLLNINNKPKIKRNNTKYNNKNKRNLNKRNSNNNKSELSFNIVSLLGLLLFIIIGFALFTYNFVARQNWIRLEATVISNECKLLTQNNNNNLNNNNLDKEILVEEETNIIAKEIPIVDQNEINKMISKNIKRYMYKKDIESKNYKNLYTKSEEEDVVNNRVYNTKFNNFLTNNISHNPLIESFNVNNQDCIVVSYMVDKEIIKTKIYGDIRRFKINDKLNIMYNPNNKYEIIQIKSIINFNSVMFLLMFISIIMILTIYIK